MARTAGFGRRWSDALRWANAGLLEPSRVRAARQLIRDNLHSADRGVWDVELARSRAYANADLQRGDARTNPSAAKELAQRAQAGTLGVDEFQGGTFSVSNLGMFGVDQFDAIINLPQAAILAIAAGKKKPVVRGDSIVPATVMRVSLSSDHRAIDGAVAAKFLQALKGFLENPASMLL